MEIPPNESDQRSGPELDGTVSLPKPFPLVRYYLLASVLLVVGAFAILNFSTLRIQSGTAINSLRQDAEADIERVVFDVSLAVTSYIGPGDDLATAIDLVKREFDRDIINALSGHPISRVDLFTPSGSLIYSTDPNAGDPNIGPAISDGDARRVVSGDSFSRYHEEYALTLFNGQPADIATVITANPVNAEWSVESTGPVAVLVAFRDVTDAVPGVTGLVAPERIAVLGGTMAALFVLLSWIVIRGHRFTVEARERLSELLETERTMREQLDVHNTELQEANQAKSQFLTMISHELKTPLTSIVSFAGTLRKSLGDSMNERETKQFDALSGNSTLLKMLIDELLDVSAAATGKLSLNFEQVTAGGIANEAVQLVQPMLDARNQKLTVSVADPKLEFRGDPGRLQQVIANLLSNASKYSPIESQLEFDVIEHVGNICFRVTDQGIGISPEDQQQLFSTFFRSEKAVASGAPGTGIGLVIVRSIVEGHGGVVKIDSEVDSGTSVCVELPLTYVPGSTVLDESVDAA